MYLALYYNVKLVKRKSLIVFDEIQNYPKARAAIKYLVNMYPMDFEEYLWAMNQEMMYDLIKLQFKKKIPMGIDMHRKAMTLFRQYLIIGGMPKAVSTYVDTRDFKKVDSVKRAILTLYRNDIQKYADGNEARVPNIFDTIPS